MPELSVEPDGQYGQLTQKFLRFVNDGFGEPQSARDAAAVVARAATTDTPRFRWQTSEAAAMSAGLSLRDLDGSGVVTAMSVLLQ